MRFSPKQNSQNSKQNLFDHMLKCDDISRLDGHRHHTSHVQLASQSQPKQLTSKKRELTKITFECFLSIINCSFHIKTLTILTFNYIPIKLKPKNIDKNN